MRVMALFFAFAFTIWAGCSSQSQTVVFAETNHDIVRRDGPELTLGKNWYRYETFAGKSFRWVNDDAEVVIHHPSQSTVTLSLDLEAGPGLNTAKFPLVVLDDAYRRIATVAVDGRQKAKIVVPVQPSKDNIVRLHVDGGGIPAPKESRILNFRVFEISDSPGGTLSSSSGPPDIFDPRNGVALQQKWYPVEMAGDKPFRWVPNDAGFIVFSPRDQSTRLRLTVEAGPGLNTSNFTLGLLDSTRKPLGSALAKGRAVVLFPVHLHGGENRFFLHVNGGGKPAPNDPRTLNFRVFALSALR